MKCPCCKYEDDCYNFKTIQLISDIQVTVNEWSERIETDIDQEYLHVCPKCGVAFKGFS